MGAGKNPNAKDNLINIDKLIVRVANKTIIIKNRQEEDLAGVLHKANERKELVIVCHGIAGTKEENFIKQLCGDLEDSYINAFRFDFSGSGESEGKYIESTTTKQISDLRSVVDYFDKQGFAVGLIGHSRGGMESLLEASDNQRIRFVISIAGMAYTKKFLERIFPRQRAKIFEGKKFYWDEEQQGKKYPVTPEKVTDLESYNPLIAVKKITCPILFIHGDKDRTILLEEGEDLYKEANKPKYIKIFRNADHCFTNPEHLKAMIKFIINWIKELGIK